MKKNINIILVMIISLIILTGCQNKNNDLPAKPTNNIYEKEFGSYQLLDGWVENKEHSTNNKFFYVLEGTEKKKRPNNISINVGTNRYPSSEHPSFKDAIVKQLSYQISNKEDITLEANGSYTDNGYVLYTFIIKEEKENITTIQYYIVGDYKYVLIHATVYDDSEETITAAKKILNTFKWNE